MEPTTILLLAGVFFVLLGIAGTLASSYLAIPPLPKSLRVCVGIIGMGLLIVGIITSRNTAPSPEANTNRGNSKQSPIVEEKNEPALRAGEVKITEPKDDAIVTTGNPASGVYANEVTDDIWIFVWPERSPGVGWPQSDDAATGKPALKKNGRWSVYCNFGGPPQSYQIVVYTATFPASKFIGESLQNWYRTNNYVGLSTAQLPDGLSEKARIRVTKLR